MPRQKEFSDGFLEFASSGVFVGIDLAWGERNPDGVCCLLFDGRNVTVYDITLTVGDEMLFQKILEWKKLSCVGLIAIDAPLIIKNRNGMRPVDKLTHQLYRKQHAGCHPAYLEKIQRPVRIAKRLINLGIPVSFQIPTEGFGAIEVYPHISMIHAFGLQRILKYKKGNVAKRAKEFKKYQTLLHDSLFDFFPKVATDSCLEMFLKIKPWSKTLEDQTDALFCALIAWHHWYWKGMFSEVLGDEETGFIVNCLPRKR